LTLSHYLGYFIKAMNTNFFKISAKAALAAALITLASALAGCALEEPGVDPPKQAVYFPTGIALHPNGKYLVAVNANSNLSYKNGSLSVIDLAQETSANKTGKGRIIGAWTTPIGSFAGMAQFNKAGTKLFVTSRGARKESSSAPAVDENSLYIFDINPDAQPDGKPFFKGLKTIPLAADPFDVKLDADDKFVYVTHLSNGEISIIQTQLGEPTDAATKDLFYKGNSEDKEGSALFNLGYCLPKAWKCPADAPLEGVCAKCGALGTYACNKPGEICLSAQNEYPASEFCVKSCVTDADCGSGDYFCGKLTQAYQVAERKMDAGLDGLAIHPSTGTVYASSKYLGRIGLLRPYYVQGRPIEADVTSFTATDGSDIRGLAFASYPANIGGDVKDVLIAANRNDDSFAGLIIIDATEDKTRNNFRLGRGLEKNEVIDFIPTCLGPSDVAVAEGLVFVSCFLEDLIAVYDLYTWRQVDAFVVSTTDTKREMGPYKLIAYANDAVNPATGKTERELYVVASMFRGHEIQLWRVNINGTGAPHELLLRVHNHSIEY